MAQVILIGKILTQQTHDYFKILALANLEGDPKNEESFKQDIDKIIDFISIIKNANIPESTVALSHPTGASYKLREDETQASPLIDELIEGAPHSLNNFLLVPKVIDSND